jgi:hypothetical protein
LLFPVVDTFAPLPRISPMLFGLIDGVTSASSLKTALDRSVDRTRVIADRVSKASLQNGDGFALEASGKAGAQNANPVCRGRDDRAGG